MIDLAAKGVALDLLDGLDSFALDGVLDDLGELDGDGALERLLQQELDDVQLLDLIHRTAPLATVPLWVHSDAHWEGLPEWARVDVPEVGPDQRQMAIAMLSHAVSIGGGGNRAGKTFAMFCVLICVALGRDHPMVAAFLELNRIPAHLVPEGPGRVYIVARSASVSRDLHRNVVDSLLPPDSVKWVHKNALSEAYVEIEVPGHEEKARISFKSIDQKENKFRGIEGRACGIDEEPLGDDGLLKFKEMQRAVSGFGGVVIVAATTQDGETWLAEMMEDPSRCWAGRLDSLRNYLIPNIQGLLRHFKGMEPWEIAVRRFGQPVSNTKRVYQEFQIGDRDRWGRYHVCEPFDIPADWPRFLGADFGIRDPTAVLWGALGDDSTLYVYREHVANGLTWDEHADALHELMGHAKDDRGIWRRGEHGEALELAWGDPAQPDAIKRWRLADIGIRKAHNARLAGIDTVRGFLRVQVDGRSRLKVFSSCAKTIRCLQRYQWNERMRGQVPLKKDDHEADALRYLSVGVARWLGL